MSARAFQFHIMDALWRGWAGKKLSKRANRAQMDREKVPLSLSTYVHMYVHTTAGRWCATPATPATPAGPQPPQCRNGWKWIRVEPWKQKKRPLSSLMQAMANLDRQQPSWLGRDPLRRHRLVPRPLPPPAQAQAALFVTCSWRINGQDASRRKSANAHYICLQVSKLRIMLPRMRLCLRGTHTHTTRTPSADVMLHGNVQALDFVSLCLDFPPPPCFVA